MKQNDTTPKWLQIETHVGTIWIRASAVHAAVRDDDGWRVNTGPGWQPRKVLQTSNTPPWVETAI